MESTDDEVAALLDELDRAELVRLVHGALDPEGTATGYLPGVERLDVPPLRFVDGPLGVRIPDRRATAFPAPLALAASFDPSLARSQGAAMGREAAAHGQDVLLGPGTNLIRVPHGGRNFEYFSEDPVHSAAFAAAVVEGVQSEDVLACVKHYVANNQETDRATVDVRVGEQPLRELYLPAFRAAVDAGAGAVMSGYNSVNGTPMSEHGRLLGDVLKGEWGFEGFVVSDWFGTTDSVRSANGGLDVEMPGVTGEELASLMGMDEGGPDVDFDELGGGMPDMRTAARFETELAADVEAGDVSADRLADMAGRVLSQMASVGRLDGERPDGALDTDEHRALAERVAVRGTVLLANDGVLPLDDEADVAVVGPNVDEALLGGGGSSEVTPFVSSTPVEGVTERAGGEVTVAHGVEPVADLSFFEETEPPADADSSVEDAAAAAADADVAVVFVRDRATEAMDRPDLRLPGRQDELVSAVADANDRTVVVVNSSGPVELPWREDVAAVVENWYPGQAHGDAAAAVLYGDSGGRLTGTRRRRCCTGTAPPAAGCRCRSPRSRRIRLRHPSGSRARTESSSTARGAAWGTATSRRATTERSTRSGTASRTRRSRTAAPSRWTHRRYGRRWRTRPSVRVARSCRRTCDRPTTPTGTRPSATWRGSSLSTSTPGKR